MSKAVERRLRKIEKRTVLRVGTLPLLRPEEQAYIDALLIAGEALCDPDAALSPIPSDDHLSRAGKIRVQTYFAERLRWGQADCD